MRSPLVRVLLRLYPRRVRRRFGDELLELHDELRAHGEISRWRAIRDTVSGVLLVRSGRRLALGAVLLLAGCAAVGVGLSSSARRAPRPPTLSVNAIAGGSCFVAGGPSCSLDACTQYTAQAVSAPAVEVISGSVTRARATARCVSDPRPPRLLVPQVVAVRAVGH